MLYVKTRIGPSEIHGTGLFADEFIPKGTVVWRFTPGFDVRFTKRQILGLPEAVQRYLISYAWKSKKSGRYCLASDDARYFNHSDHPNCRSKYVRGEEEVVTRAVRNIRTGAEMTDYYPSFAADQESERRNILNHLYEKYHPGD